MTADDAEPPRSGRGAFRRRVVPRPAGPSNRARAEPALRVTISDARGRTVRVPGLAAWLASVAPPAAHGEVAVAIVGDAAMRALNRTYGGRNHLTDVLSFPAGDDPLPSAGAPSPARASRPTATRPVPTAHRSAPVAKRPAAAPTPRLATRLPADGHHPPPARLHLGDIVIARRVAERQAGEAGHSLGAELRVLALHGLLHLLGYDHDRDAGEMARVERRLRRKGGLEAGLIERRRRS